MTGNMPALVADPDVDVAAVVEREIVRNIDSRLNTQERQSMIAIEGKVYQLSYMQDGEDLVKVFTENIKRQTREGILNLVRELENAIRHYKAKARAQDVKAYPFSQRLRNKGVMVFQDDGNYVYLVPMVFAPKIVVFRGEPFGISPQMQKTLRKDIYVRIIVDATGTVLYWQTEHEDGDRFDQYHGSCLGNGGPKLSMSVVTAEQVVEFAETLEKLWEVINNDSPGSRHPVGMPRLSSVVRGRRKLTTEGTESWVDEEKVKDPRPKPVPRLSRDETERSAWHA